MVDGYDEFLAFHPAGHYVSKTALNSTPQEHAAIYMTVGWACPRQQHFPGKQHCHGYLQPWFLFVFCWLMLCT